jgi:hypothetical protein
VASDRIRRERSRTLFPDLGMKVARYRPVGDRKNGKNPGQRPTVTADQPTLPVERFPQGPAPAWRVELLARVLALPFSAARYLLGGIARTGQRLRRLRDSFQHRGEHVWRDWLGRRHG